MTVWYATNVNASPATLKIHAVTDVEFPEVWIVPLDGAVARGAGGCLFAHPPGDAQGGGHRADHGPRVDGAAAVLRRPGDWLRSLWSPTFSFPTTRLAKTSRCSRTRA